MPGVVAAGAADIVVVKALAPAVDEVELLVPPDLGLGDRFVADGIDDAFRRHVAQRGGKRAIDEVELRVRVVAGEAPALDAVEAAVAQHELLVPVLAAIMPHRRLGAGVDLVDVAVGDVAPAARADEVHGTADLQTRVVVAAGVALPERERVVALAVNVAVRDHGAVGLAVDGEGVLAR